MNLELHHDHPSTYALEEGMKLYCPAHIEFLLWCHTTNEPFPNRDLAMYRSLIDALLNGDIIERYQDEMKEVYKTTPKGKAWVQMLCDLEEPRQAFVDAQGNMIQP